MLSAYTPDPFELDISDYVSGATCYKRRARFVRLVHDDAARSCTIHLLLVPYAADEAGDYGPELTTGNFVAKPDQLTADNRKIVDKAEGGKILAVRELGKDAEWVDAVRRIEADPDLDAMYQGDFFLWMRDNLPLVIGQMIRDYIQQADQDGAFT